MESTRPRSDIPSVGPEFESSRTIERRAALQRLALEEASIETLPVEETTDAAVE